jgi:hypothetical protein
VKVELKRITHNSRLSHETPAYAADVWVDGVKRGTTQNDGHGGADLISPRDLECQLNEYAATLPPIESYGMVLTQNAEMLLQGLLDRHLEGKRLKRLMSKKVVFVRDGKVWCGPVRPGPASPSAFVVLNDKPFEEALDLFLVHGQRA